MNPMAFAVEDVQDLLRVLRENPEWREAVRREVLGDELLTLPDLVRSNSVAIDELRATTADLRASIEDLRTTMREEFRRVDSAIAALADDVRQIVRELRRLAGRVGSLEGSLSETKWQQHFSGRFGGVIYRSRLLTPRDLEHFEGAYEDGTLDEAEARAVRNLDLIIEGVMGRGDTRRNVILAVEVSVSIEPRDVERAVARAETLRRVGYDAVPVVAGARMDASLRDDSVARGVEVVLRPDDIAETDDIEP